MTSSEANTRRRVKLYMLNDERQWDDKGTGHVSALYTEQDNIALVVISENDGSCLLESKIQPDTAYQKQQETLIVWSEGENMDLALSFQEKAGCDDIWEKICSVQGKDPSVEITQDVVDESDDADDVESYTPSSNQSLQAFELPPCELNRLEEIADLIIQPPLSLQKRERLVSTFERTNYIRQLIELFHKAEDLEDSESLHHLYEIFRQLILFNKQSLYEILFSDDIIMDVIGILEFSPTGRIKHRDFLRNQATFKEVLPLHNLELVSKIHQTYRVQYIQDCCLPPPCLFDEHTMSLLKTFISLNKIEIIGAIQEDEEMMLQLFSCLKSPDTLDSHRRELALFVKEFCNLSVQTDRKDSFLNCLLLHGALPTVEVLISYQDRDVKAAALEILHAFLEHQPSVVREFICKESNPLRRDSEILMNLMITQLLNDPDPELSDAFLLGYMLRILIDPDNMNNIGGRNEKTEFLSFFYRRCIGTLTQPLFDNTINETPLHDDYHTALVLSNVLELLTFCIESHAYHIKNYCLHRELVKRVLVLLRSTHKFLVLGALRLLRRVINMKEEFYNRYLMKNCLFKPVIELLISNNHRYNMIDSAVIELFEYIRGENITSLIVHIIDKYWDILKDIKYVQTFTGLKERYDVLHRSNRPESTVFFSQQASTVNVLPLRTATNTRFHRTHTEFDDDEEQWFSHGDEEDEDEPPTGNLHSGLSCLSSDRILTPTNSCSNIQNSISSSSIDNLPYCPPSSLSNCPFDSTGSPVHTKEIVDKFVFDQSPLKTLPPLVDKNSNVDSPIHLRPSLIRQPMSISINIKSTVNSFPIIPLKSDENNTVSSCVNGEKADIDKMTVVSLSEKLDDVNAVEVKDQSKTIRHATKRPFKILNKPSKKIAFNASDNSSHTEKNTEELIEKQPEVDKPEGVVGLVDYSDEESDDDENDYSSSESENSDSANPIDSEQINQFHSSSLPNNNCKSDMVQHSSVLPISEENHTAPT